MAFTPNATHAVAHLAVHTAIRTLMHQAVAFWPEPIDPGGLSFTAALRAACRSITVVAGTFPLSGWPANLPVSPGNWPKRSARPAACERTLKLI